MLELPRRAARAILPVPFKNWLHEVVNSLPHLKQRSALAVLRYRLFDLSRKDTVEKLGNYQIRINDGPNFYVLYKDLFHRQIYHFESSRPDPYVLDCGSNIGASILYFKQLYPQARIVGFEPDPTILPYLQENIQQNQLKNVTLVNAGVAATEGTLTLYSDAKYGSTLSDTSSAEAQTKMIEYKVPTVRLRDYLTEPVDFVKMNIEGAEWEVLADSADRLDCVRELIIEYHHLPGLPRTLHKILELLDQHGFEYLINDFDRETNPEVEPPFHISPQTRYFLLIYARRIVND